MTRHSPTITKMLQGQLLGIHVGYEVAWVLGRAFRMERAVDVRVGAVRAQIEDAARVPQRFWRSRALPILGRALLALELE